MKKNNIVLIGFMGSGKTTVGIRLSYRFRRVVEDTDKLIEKKEGRSVSQIFQTEGEGYFRELETAVLKTLCASCKDQILSVGGGTPVGEVNRPLLKELGTVVYLRVQPETVWERLKTDTTRPLLQGENPKEKIKKLLAEREEAYEACADRIIDTDALNADQIVDLIEKYVMEEEENENTGDKRS